MNITEMGTAFLQLLSSSLELKAIQTMCLSSKQKCNKDMDENFHANVFGNANRA